MPPVPPKLVEPLKLCIWLAPVRVVAPSEKVVRLPVWMEPAPVSVIDEPKPLAVMPADGELQALLSVTSPKLISEARPPDWSPVTFKATMLLSVRLPPLTPW